jgi:diguanylate cyclase (GGDEF)-like protein/PAS domain S-box-containing protein
MVVGIGPPMQRMQRVKRDDRVTDAVTPSTTSTTSTPSATPPPHSPLFWSAFGRSMNEEMADPVGRLAIAMGLLTAVALWLLGHAGVVSRQPLWVWLVLMVGALAVRASGRIRKAGPVSTQARIAMQVGVVTVIMYLTGWGPVLGIGYIVVMRDNAANLGPQHWRSVAAWSAGGLTAGFALIAAGVAPTLLHRPMVYGLSGLVAIGTVYTIVLLGMSAERTALARQSLSDSEGRLRRIIETANDAYIEFDSAGTIREWNRQAEMTFGWSYEEALDQRMFDLVVPTSMTRQHHIELARLFGADGGGDDVRVRQELTALHRDGHHFPIELSVWQTGSSDGSTFSAFVQDITQRVNFTRDLRHSRESFRLLFQQHPHPMWVVDHDTLKFLEVNGSATELYGYTRDEFLGMRVTEIYPDEDVPVILKFLTENGPDFRHSGTWRHRTKSGELLNVEGVSHGLQFRGHQAILEMAQDVTERCRLVNQLQQRSLYDPLTGLANRSLLLDRADRLGAQVARTGVPVTVMSLNLDNFQLINDAYGHDIGDGLLRAVGERLLEGLRNVDTVARIGGDEFVILAAPPVPVAAPEILAKRLLELVRGEPFRIQDLELTLTASVGVASGAGIDGQQLVRNADVALWAAKAQGRNQFVIFAPEMQSAVHDRVELAMDLREAIRGNQFESFYQPVVSLRDLKIVGMEALVRWRHPKLGLIAPARFISAAEEIGMIGEIGEAVLQQACAQGVLWNSNRENLSVAINVSVFQLQADDFVSKVSETLEHSGFRPENLILEVTESSLMNDAETMGRRLRSLKQLGVRLAIDDFGTGYSSLSYLTKYPFDILKIDQSFIASVGSSPESVTMLRTILQLGRYLNLEVVAEGVEEEEQCDLLRRMHCPQAQGYLFSRPMSAHDIDGVLRTWAPAQR